jgi:hypothetical protein
MWQVHGQEAARPLDTARDAKEDAADARAHNEAAYRATRMEESHQTCYHDYTIQIPAATVLGTTFRRGRNVADEAF